MLRGINSIWARARYLTALFLLCAFSLQAYIVQTHIHPIPTPVAAATGNPAQHHAPAQQGDPDDCPICQAFALSGAFVSPAIIILPIAAVAGNASSAPDAAGALAVSYRHSWQSRAPPQQ